MRKSVHLVGHSHSYTFKVSCWLHAIWHDGNCSCLRGNASSQL